MPTSRATFRNIDFAIEPDRDFPCLYGHVDYDDGGAQGFSLVIDTAFLIRLLYVFNAHRLRELEGARAQVTHDHTRITRIISLDGERDFDIDVWSGWARLRSDANATMEEMRFGTALTARRPDDAGPRTRPRRGPRETALIDPPDGVSGPHAIRELRASDLDRLDAMAACFAPPTLPQRPKDAFDLLEEENCEDPPGNS